MWPWQILSDYFWRPEPPQPTPSVPAQPNWSYSQSFLDALAAEGVILSDETKAAHEQAFREKHPSEDPLVFAKNTYHPYSLFNFPGIGPSVGVKVLGKGAFGTVEKHIAADGRVFAVKLSAFNDRTEYLQNFRKKCFDSEKEVVGARKHLLGSYRDNNVGYLALPYHEGLSLLEFVTTKFVSSNVLITLMIKIVDELEEIHNLNYLHNDLNLGNVMINPAQVDVNVIDHGYSRKIGEYAPGSLAELNVPEFMAQDFAKRTVESETYTLGLWFLVLSQLSKVFAAPLIYFSVIRKMVSVEPKDRPSLIEVRQNLLSVFHQISMMLGAVVGLSIGLSLGLEKVNVLEAFSVPKKDQHRDLVNTAIAVLAALFTFCANYQVQKPYRTLLLSREVGKTAGNNNLTKNLQFA